MNVKIKGKKIVISRAPEKDVAGAFLIMSTKLDDDMAIIDAKKGQKEYDLPEEVDKKDVEALYLRVV